MEKLQKVSHPQEGESYRSMAGSIMPDAETMAHTLFLLSRTPSLEVAQSHLTQILSDLTKINNGLKEIERDLNARREVQLRGGGGA